MQTFKVDKILALLSNMETKHWTSY